MPTIELTNQCLRRVSLVSFANETLTNFRKLTGRENDRGSKKDIEMQDTHTRIEREEGRDQERDPQRSERNKEEKRKRERERERERPKDKQAKERARARESKREKKRGKWGKG